MTNKKFEIIVVGAGHAGVEAALISARCNHNTALVSLSIENIAKMPCNPSVGGPAKGIVVREIDALGGQMAITADQTALQFKMLNTAKGPGVQSLRVQSDKLAYAKMMQDILLKQENCTVIEAMVKCINTKNRKMTGVTLKDGSILNADIVILTTGTYMSSLTMVSDQVTEYGPDHEETTNTLSQSLRDLGIKTFRLKTGTPARILTSSIDFSKTEPQPGSDFKVCFSESSKETLPPEQQVLCHLTYTNEKTHEIIRRNLNKSSMYSGVVKGVGPRYCPSIEDKLVRFQDKERHQIFLEPESKDLDTTYIQGFSTSMPHNVQDEMVHSLMGCENAIIKKYAYAIEYDAVDPLQLKPSLETKIIENLFCAGQINGTSGYEEAAGQGLIAGINAVMKLEKKDPFILRRDEAYIGVMIDDLVTKGTLEPYRLLTSRAEFRLLLRHDNADQRLTEKAWKLGLISKYRYDLMETKLDKMRELVTQLKEVHFKQDSPVNEYLKQLGYETLTDKLSGYDLIRRPHVTCVGLRPYLNFKIDELIAKQVEIECKYEGYIEKAKKEASKLEHMDKVRIPSILNYDDVGHLSLEGRQKLIKHEPQTLGQASRISGVSPADISILAMVIEQTKREKKMKINDVINNVNVYGFEESIRGSKFPMATDLTSLDGSFGKSTVRLGISPIGEGHDNFLNGILVQFDLTFTNKAWVEAERYHFLDFVSSQSTMHRITKFNLDEVYNEYVDLRMIEIMKEKVAVYNTLMEQSKENNDPKLLDELRIKYLEILYSNPAGFKVTARMTTNYRQLKTIYQQRKTHRLPEWRTFCEWLKTLPHSEFITRELTEEKK